MFIIIFNAKYWGSGISGNKYIGQNEWGSLDDLEKLILTYMSGKITVTRSELCETAKKSNATISKRLNHLLDMGIITINGNKYDAAHTYSLK